MVATFAAGQSKIALLVGINTYTPDNAQAVPAPETGGKPHAADSRFSGFVAWPNLEGPERDVESMGAALPDFGFTQIHLLTGQNATREEILSEIARYLVDGAKRGDTVLFYFAGHGSQRYNSKSSKLDHLDETIVPADAYKGAFDIRDKELAREFNRAIDKGVHVVAIFDSCHSGTMARGIKVGRSRWLPYDDRDAADGGDYGVPGSPHKDPPAKRGAIIVSAALSTQSAEEIDEPGGKAHGVFTAAFLKALVNSTPAWTALDVVNSTDAMLTADGWSQQPTVEGAVNQALFGPFTAQGIRGTVAEIDGPDKIILRAGSVFGFGEGSEFVNDSIPQTRLAITSVTSPSSSVARVISGNAADIRPGDPFRIAKLVVPAEAKITIFLPGFPSREQWNDILAQTRQVHGSTTWSLVDDPAAELASSLIYWTPTGWMLTLSSGSTVSLGGILDDTVISKNVPHGAKVFLSLPPQPGMEKVLRDQLSSSSGAIAISNSVSDSEYVLIGRWNRNNASNVEYALALPSIFGGLPASTIVHSTVEGKTVSCSTGSELPLRTDWTTSGPTTQSIAALGSQLAAAAFTLGRDRAWLRVGSNADNSFWPYHLTVIRSDGKDLSDTDTLTSGSEYDVELTADPAELASTAVHPQYVYLFGLQCDGAGTLLFPESEFNGGAPLPLISDTNDGRRYPARIRLTHLKVAPPVGLDTVVLLATPERISDLSAFNYSGVVSSSARGAGNELEQLVKSLSGKSRGIGAVSANWSVQRVTVRSH